jgi:hypothetical protein
VLRHATAKVANDHFGFVDDSIDIISPPLEHFLALLCELGNDTDGPNSLCLMVQRLFDYISIEAMLCEQRCARSARGRAGMVME